MTTRHPSYLHRRRPGQMDGITRRPGPNGTTVYSLTQTQIPEQQISNAELMAQLQAQKTRRQQRG